MADVEKSLDILIRTKAELAGARTVEKQLETDIGKAKALGQAHDELSKKLATVQSSILAATTANKDLGEGMAEGAKHSEFLGLKHAQLHKVVHQLSEAFPVAGMAVRSFLSPVMVAATLAVTAFTKIKESINQLNAKLDEMEANATTPLGNFAAAFRKAQQDAASSSNTFLTALKDTADALEKIKTKGDEAVAAIRELETAQLEKVSAQEAKLIAQINEKEARFKATGGKDGLSPVDAIKARTSVKDHYEKERRDIATQSDQKAVAAKQKEYDESLARATDLELQRISLGDPAALRARATVKKEQADAARKRAAGKFDPETGMSVPDSDNYGKTLDQQISDKSTRLDELQYKRKRIEKLPADNLMRVQLPDIAEERDRVFAERDALKGKKKKLDEDATKWDAQSAALNDQAAAAEKLKGDSAAATKALEALAEAISKLIAQSALKRETRDITGRDAQETRHIEARTSILDEQTKERKDDHKAERDALMHQPGTVSTGDLGVNHREKPDLGRLAAPLESNEALFAEVVRVLNEHAAEMRRIGSNIKAARNP